MQGLYKAVGGRKMFNGYLGATLSIVVALVYAWLSEAPPYVMVMGFVFGALGVSAGAVALEDGLRKKNG